MAAQARSAPSAEPAPSPAFEYRSRLKIGRLPLVHVVSGIDPSTGRRPPAIGVVAVGQVAVGVVAIGQVAIGAISIGQAAIALGWGIGQLAWGMLAAGQVAAGLLGSVGQVALGPGSIGMVHMGGAWVAVGWLLAGLALAAAVAERRRRLAPLLAQATAVPIRSVELTGETAHVAARIVSPDRLRGPLSGAPCVYWHTVDVGPAIRHHEHAGTEVIVADEGGTARVDLARNVTFIRSDHYREIAGPDWALHLETSLAQGDQVYIAGPVTVAPDHDRGDVFRGGVSPLFQGRPDQPLIVCTRAPLGIRAELRFAGAVAWASVFAGAAALIGWLT
ncbi:MAG: hypothetical protein ACJ8F1_03940 [Polyangia bacterium]|jgi:hypothetical protein